ncbi:MAG: FAD-dependent oxidoreductase, partial [Proteobacteria bacterium]|nr:FAD-dependent oxidoreductase [Pseudomonadota bacterium]
MTAKYSIFSLIRNALSYHENWPRAWRSPEPKSAYDVIIVGGGGHGLASAYYLAKEHGLTNVAVLEKGWLGGGNTGRNTTIIRSNYLWDESAALYEHSLKLWEDLSSELNFNVMLSQRGVLNLAHNLHDVREAIRRVNANRLNGIDAEWLDHHHVKTFCPIINVSREARYPVMGATLQRRGGVARHDAVAWGFARGADARGVDIIQNCEVTALRRGREGVTGVETTRGAIRAGKVAIAVAGHSSVLAAMAGLRLPIETYSLQALVSEPMKPV